MDAKHYLYYTIDLMLNLVIYLFFLLLELAVAIIFCGYFITLIYSSIKGAPYVPTKFKELERFLKQAGLKKGKTFLELGSGDGRVVRTAVKKYGVKGIGVDANTVLNKVAAFKAKREKLKDIQFITTDMVGYKLPQADYIYLFLFPELMERIKPELEKAIKNGTIIISHGFKVKNWESRVYKMIENRPFNTYYYRFNRRSS